MSMILEDLISSRLWDFPRFPFDSRCIPAHAAAPKALNEIHNTEWMAGDGGKPTNRGNRGF